MSGTIRQTTAEAIGLPPREAIEFFRQKTNVPTRTWTDVWNEGHSRGFAVAGAASEALLNDFRREIDKALEQGTTLADFRKQFDAIVAKHGWEYNGSPGWRSQVIYETNLSTAYSAGRYAQQTEPETLVAFPYWQYVHSGAQHPRLQHLAWNGLTLRADDPWWSTHYPPNGWKCGCRTRVVSERGLARMGKAGPDQAPPVNMRPWVNPRTGQVVDVPEGIDPGFGYNPGEAWKRGTPPPASGEPAPVPTAPPPPPAPGGMERLRSRPPATIPQESPRSVPVPAPAAEIPASAPSLPAAPAVQVPAPLAGPPRAELERFLAAPQGNLPLGGLAPDVQAAIGARTDQVLLSRDTVVKQLAHHPDLTVDEYASVASILAHPEMVLQEPAKRRHASLVRVIGAMHHVVVKATQDGREVYLVSFFRIRPADLARLLRRSEILIDNRPPGEGG
ncbi:MAG: phage minor head protein [Roseomonas mucosa]|nr:phage minor head protein [Roseomonas mucosa]